MSTRSTHATARHLDEDAVIRRLSLVSVVGNAILSGFKLLAGIWGHSGAMISDAIHSFSDVLTTLIAWIGVKVSRRAADAAHPYGHERLECVASLILGVVLMATGLGVGRVDVYKRQAKLEPVCEELFRDIDKDTVDFVPNYDGTTTEPTLLPVTFPTILANNTLGIAVGMASNICSFNLAELCNATIALMKDENADLMQLLPAPDFVGGGSILYDAA